MALFADETRFLQMQGALPGIRSLQNEAGDHPVCFSFLTVINSSSYSGKSLRNK